MNSQTNLANRFFIHTVGCKVNQYESQAMREALIGSGFKESLSAEMADIYIVNTCTVTGHADRDSRYAIGFLHRANPKARIVVTGCYAENNGHLISFLPGVFSIVKNSDKKRIAEILDPALKGDKPFGITGFKDHTKAFVKIQDGCENFCAYCKVPFVRGSPVSRPMAEIVEEVKGLVSNGYKEIVLTGICLGAWGKDLFPHEIARNSGIEGAALTDVLKALNKLPGDFRIRLSSIEPKYVTDKLIKFMADNDKMCRHLHMPLQSGDDEVLKRMKRPYTTEDYMALVNSLRLAVKDIAITTDILVGFPGETDGNFKNTVEFIKRFLPARSHIFTFSRREGTAAYSMDGQVDKDTAKRHYYTLRAVAMAASYTYRERFLNEILNVLVENKRDRHTGLLVGYSDNYIRVLFDGPESLMNKIIPIRISEMNLEHTMGVYEG